MLQISAEQFSLMEKMGLIAKLDKSLGRQYADFAALPDEERITFLVDCLRHPRHNTIFEANKAFGIVCVGGVLAGYRF